MTPVSPFTLQDVTEVIMIVNIAVAYVCPDPAFESQTLRTGHHCHGYQLGTLTGIDRVSRRPCPLSNPSSVPPLI